MTFESGVFNIDIKGMWWQNGGEGMDKTKCGSTDPLWNQSKVGTRSKSREGESNIRDIDHITHEFRLIYRILYRL